MKSNEQLVAILFSDLKGYSKIKDNNLLTKILDLNNEIKNKLLNSTNHFYCNTWGDAFFICSYNCSDLAEIALRMIEIIKDAQWKKLGFQEDLAIRIGLHVQKAVLQSDNDKVIDVIGSEISRAARIEPIVEENQIYCSKSYYQIVSDEKNFKFKWTYLGNKKLAKDFGEMEIYRIERASLKVLFLFDDADIDAAKLISKELIKQGVEVYNNNTQLLYELVLNKNILDPEVSYSLILLTEKYFENKLTRLKDSSAFEQTIKNENFIFIIKVGTNFKEIPTIESVIGEIKISNNSECGIAIETFLDKIINFEKANSITIKPYRSIETILNLFRPHLSFEKIDQFLNSSDKIGYELYLASDPLINSTRHYFLYLYAGRNINKSHKYIAQKHPDIFVRSNLTILIPKEKKQKIPERRKNNISSLFNPTKIFYIDDFIWIYCTPEDFKKQYSKFGINNYVDPYFAEQKGIRALSYLRQWYVTENNPILVIKGSGGIGKTTLVKYFSDILAADNKNFRSLFIDTNEIVNRLKQHVNRDNLDLYDFYEASSQLSHKPAINEDIFRLNIDNGNILVIVDGLDEIISKVDDFNLDNFLKSIHDYSNEIGNGKVLITCRNYFWDKSNPVHNFESVELLPFDIDLAKEFFKQYFPHNEKLVNKGLKLANNLLRGSNEYIPFVLDIISYILREESDNSDFEDPSFITDLLNIQIKNDYILYKLCEREGLKLGTPNVDYQIRFFIKLATNFNSIIKSDKIRNLIADTFIEKVDEDQIKAHPVLLYKDNTITFRYDFLEEHFKNVYLGLLFKQVFSVDLVSLEIMNSYIKFNSVFIDDCCTRLGVLDDNRKLVLINIINEIISFKECKGFMKEKAISAVFQIVLKNLQKTASLNIQKTTEIMKDLFYSNGTIKYLALEKINVINSPKIIFDFSNLKLSDCYFSEYDYFWECKFDTNTYFNNCILSCLDAKDGIVTSAKSNNFNLKTCVIDESIEKVLHKRTEHIGNLRQRKINDLRIFLKLFYKHGNMIAEKETILRSKYKGQFNEMSKLLSEVNLVEDYPSEKKSLGRQLHIPDDKKQDAIRFCLEGTMTPPIKKALDAIFKYYE